MNWEEETLFTSNERIIDADLKKENTIVLLKGKGENFVQLNGQTILTCIPGHTKIRFAKEHFCLLNDVTLTFYTFTGEYVSECDVGNDVYELFPYRQGVLCIYGDEGVFGKKSGKNRLNYAAPLHKLESCYDKAVQNGLLYEALFARYKPYACLSWETNELLILDEQLDSVKKLKVPFDAGNVLSFSLTYHFGVFLEENKLWIWEFETPGQAAEYPGKFFYNTRAIFQRHDFLFVSILKHEVRVSRPGVKIN